MPGAAEMPGTAAMTVRVADDGAVVLEGACPVGDADAVARFLLLDPAASVDWRACDHLHTAIVQVLLAARPAMLGPPRSSFLREWVAPVLSGTPA
jgi:hypothetical protein